MQEGLVGTRSGAGVSITASTHTHAHARFQRQLLPGCRLQAENHPRILPGRLIRQDRVILVPDRVDGLVFIGFVRQLCEQQTQRTTTMWYAVLPI